MLVYQIGEIAVICEPKVAIVLINWNSFNDIDVCIKSILQLDYNNYHIVVVDNSSSDDSLEKIKQRYPANIYIESNINLGFGRANNLGINHAFLLHAEYCWILNSDTVVEKSSLRYLVRTMEKDKRLGAAGSSLMEYDEIDKIQAMGGGRCWEKIGITTTYKEQEDFLEHITGASFFVKSSVMKEIGCFDKNFFFFMEDTDLSIRIRKKGYRLGLCPQSLVYHKGGSSFQATRGEKNINSELYYFESLGIFMKKHSNLFYLLIRLLLMILSRMKRMQFDRILLLSKAMVTGYLSGKSKKFENE